MGGIMQVGSCMLYPYIGCRVATTLKVAPESVLDHAIPAWPVFMDDRAVILVYLYPVSSPIRLIWP